MVNDAVMKHKCLKGLSPSYCQTNFQLEILSMMDRQDIEIASIFHLVESMLANPLFFYLGVKMWNNLSRDLREITNTCFKRRLINELICNMD